MTVTDWIKVQFWRDVAFWSCDKQNKLHVGIEIYKFTRLSWCRCKTASNIRHQLPVVRPVCPLSAMQLSLVTKAYWQKQYIATHTHTTCTYIMILMNCQTYWSADVYGIQHFSSCLFHWKCISQQFILYWLKHYIAHTHTYLQRLWSWINFQSTRVLCKWSKCKSLGKWI